MLPTHVFADVVGYLHFYDLDALLLTDAICSDLTQSAASKIRTFDFSDYTFVFCTAEVHVYNLTDDDVEHWETALKFLDATDLISFIPVALRKYTLGWLAPFYEVPSDAMRQVTHTVVVKDTLYLSAKAFATAHALVEFVTSFRSVQVPLVLVRFT